MREQPRSLNSEQCRRNVILWQPFLYLAMQMLRNAQRIHCH